MRNSPSSETALQVFERRFAHCDDAPRVFEQAAARRRRAHALLAAYEERLADAFLEFFSCSLTDDCDRKTRSAPADTLPDSATATKVRSCVRSNPRWLMFRLSRWMASVFPAFPMEAVAVGYLKIIAEESWQTGYRQAAWSSADARRDHKWKVLGVGFAANASFSAAFSGIPTTAVYLRSGYHLGNEGTRPRAWHARFGHRGQRTAVGAPGRTAGATVACCCWDCCPPRRRSPALRSSRRRSARMCLVTTLALGLLLVGLLGGSVNGSSGRAVMAWFREGERGLAMSIRQTAVPAGGGLGALLLPALASRFGFVSVYAVLALGCAITAGFAWRWLHEPAHVVDGDAGAAYGGAAHRARTEDAAEAAGDANGQRAVDAVGIVRADGTAQGARAVRGGRAVRAADAAGGGRAVHATTNGANANSANASQTKPPLAAAHVGIWRVALGAGALCVPQLAVVTFGTVFSA